MLCKGKMEYSTRDSDDSSPNSTHNKEIDGILERKQHRTNASLESKSDLTCFECNSIKFGAKCSNLSIHNKTEFRKKCEGDKKKCMVRKISYTTSTENSTSHVKVWSLERKCTNKCEEGCIVIGERTKVHACSACCTKSLCNVTNGVRCQSLTKWLPGRWAFVVAVVGLHTFMRPVEKNS
ncbi:hypothetical protein V9T40_010599 [Parthenolecanium corni]|uniref:Uncharacterized protein n=1 Tax=Parthenolecanium corni TaxID=536013 RepID=A0AAN9T7Q4_9HEMI